MKYADLCYVKKRINWNNSDSNYYFIYYKYRKDPVPGIRKKYSRMKYIRHMKTTQERRLNYAYKGYTRGKRRHLPESWDDYHRSDIYDRSWKRCTKNKTQWVARLTR